MAPLLLSHAIAYDCYCYCNPWLGALVGEHASSLPLFNGGIRSGRSLARSRGFAILPPSPPSLKPYVCLCMFTGLDRERAWAKAVLCYFNFSVHCKVYRNGLFWV